MEKEDKLSTIVYNKEDIESTTCMQTDTSRKEGNNLSYRHGLDSKELGEEAEIDPQQRNIKCTGPTFSDPVCIASMDKTTVSKKIDVEQKRVSRRDEHERTLVNSCGQLRDETSNNTKCVGGYLNLPSSQKLQV